MSCLQCAASALLSDLTLLMMHDIQKLIINREYFDQVLAIHQVWFLPCLIPMIKYMQAARMASHAADQARWQVCISLNCTACSSFVGEAHV